MILNWFLITLVFFGGNYRTVSISSKGKVYKSKCVYTLDGAKQWKALADRAFPEYRNSYEACK